MTRPPAHPAVPIRGLTIIETLAVVAIAALAATLGSAAATLPPSASARGRAHLAEIADDRAFRAPAAAKGDPR